MTLLIPPIKSQGIKTKLLRHISASIPADFHGRWIEPFMGTGVVGFNLAHSEALMCDTNPHLIDFYQTLADGKITESHVRQYLFQEGKNLQAKGDAHYYAVRERFNSAHHPLDFLFLNRACFNGMIRFNRSGGFNTPFCRKPKRFSPAYISKIANQTVAVAKLLQQKRFSFKCQPFEKTISEGGSGDIIYCDPPYIDRHADYYNAWNSHDEQQLYDFLSKSKGKFILSTWHHNAYRENQYIHKLWEQFHIVTREHYYHLGAREDNRNGMTEAIVTNYPPPTEKQQHSMAQPLPLLQRF